MVKWNSRVCEDCQSYFYLETADHDSVICPLCGSNNTSLTLQEDDRDESAENWQNLDELFKNNK